MKTVIYNSDDIIIGFDTPQIDPIETKKKIKTKFSKLPEVKEFEQEKSKLDTIARSKNRALFDCKNVFFLCAKRLGIADREMSFLISEDPAKAKEKFNADEIKKHDDFVNVINQKNDETKEIMQALHEKVKIIEKKEKDLIISDAVYFEPRKGEKIITEEEYTDLMDKLSKLDKGEKLKTTGEVVPAPVEKLEEKKG